MPRELKRLNAIDRYGVQGATGRLVLGAKEIKLMAIAENITRWYEERGRQENQAKWATEHDNESSALTVAHRLAKEFGMLKD